LGACFDLTDVNFTGMLVEAHREIAEEYGTSGRKLPENRGGDEDLRMRELDCLVINSFLLKSAGRGVSLDTVRGAFEEGPAAFPGGKIRAASHLQIAVRNPANILGVFRPQIL